MHICELVRLSPRHSAGGMQTHAVLLARSLVQQGCRVTLLTAEHTDCAEEDIGGVRVVYVPGTRPERHHAAGWAALNQAWQAIHARDPFDIVHAHSSAAEGWQRSPSGPPLVVTMHGTHWGGWLTSMRSLRGRRKGQLKSTLYLLYTYLYVAIRYLPRARAVIFISDTDVRRGRWLYPRPSRHTLIPNGIDIEHFSPDIQPANLREELSIPPEAPIIIGIGRMIAEKGFQTAVEALVNWQGTQPYLVLIGDGPVCDDLRSIANSLGVGNYLRLLPAVMRDVLPGYLNAADLFVFPTWCEEGSPYALLEAMACGLPIVASDLGSVRNLVMPNAAVLVPTMDSTALRAALQSLLADPRRAQQLGVAARQQVVEQFSATRMATATRNLFDSITQGMATR